MNEKNIVIFGSKPDSIFPNIIPNLVYSANGSASLARNFIKTTNPEAELISVVSTAAALKKDECKKILNAKPTMIYLRSHKIDCSDLKSSIIFDKFPNEKIREFSGKKQFLLDRKYFNLNAYYTYFIRGSLFKTVFILLKHILKKHYSFATSTGLWTLINALENHPDSKIFLIGIGLRAGGHFDDENHKFKETTAKKDFFLIQKLPSQDKRRIFTTDQYFASISGVNLI